MFLAKRKRIWIDNVVVFVSWRWQEWVSRGTGRSAHTGSSYQHLSIAACMFVVDLCHYHTSLPSFPWDSNEHSYILCMLKLLWIAWKATEHMPSKEWTLAAWTKRISAKPRCVCFSPAFFSQNALSNTRIESFFFSFLWLLMTSSRWQCKCSSSSA